MVAWYSGLQFLRNLYRRESKTIPGWSRLENPYRADIQLVRNVNEEELRAISTFRPLQDFSRLGSPIWHESYNLSIDLNYPNKQISSVSLFQVNGNGIIPSDGDGDIPVHIALYSLRPLGNRIARLNHYMNRDELEAFRELFRSRLPDPTLETIDSSQIPKRKSKLLEIIIRDLDVFYDKALSVVYEHQFPHPVSILGAAFMAEKAVPPPPRRAGRRAY